jgi:hypothetical protein
LFSAWGILYSIRDERTQQGDNISAAFSGAVSGQYLLPDKAVSLYLGAVGLPPAQELQLYTKIIIAGLTRNTFFSYRFMYYC